jgi:hypothetical protein
MVYFGAGPCLPACLQQVRCVKNERCVSLLPANMGHWKTLSRANAYPCFFFNLGMGRKESNIIPIQHHQCIGKAQEKHMRVRGRLREFVCVIRSSTNRRRPLHTHTHTNTHTHTHNPNTLVLHVCCFCTEHDHHGHGWAGYLRFVDVFETFFVPGRNRRGNVFVYCRQNHR